MTAPLASPQPGDTLYVVTHDRLAVRRSPTAGAAALTRLAAGAVVAGTGPPVPGDPYVGPTGRSARGWRPIRHGEGIAYVADAFLSPAPTPPPATPVDPQPALAATLEPPQIAQVAGLVLRPQLLQVAEDLRRAALASVEGPDLARSLVALQAAAQRAAAAVCRLAGDPPPAAPDDTPLPPPPGPSSPIMVSRPDRQAQSAAQAFIARCRRAGSGYGDDGLTTIAASYAREASAVGVDPVVALAQCAHETAWLSSALSQAQDRHGTPLHNFAGIGVTGAVADGPTPGHAWDADRGVYRAVVSFPDCEAGVLAHVGRLLAYAVPRAARSAAQAAAVAYALRWRALPEDCQGSAPTIRELGRAHNRARGAGCGWAAPGDHYGDGVARAMRELLAP